MPDSPPGTLHFQCNICGQSTQAHMGALTRENASCTHCRSTVRMRAMVSALSVALFGRSIALPDFPVDKSIRGVGMSDWHVYGNQLADKLDYTNTYYHQEPFLDITDIRESDIGQYDFILSTDVFEHVAPPISKAFENSLKLLKPDGVLVFSVPYTLEEDTIEHFPELHDFRIEEHEGDYRLINRTVDGRVQEFGNLIFHGGPGDTLELRLFSRKDLLRNLREAGFEDITVLSRPCFEHGIWHQVEASLPLIASRATQAPQVMEYGPRAILEEELPNADFAWVRLSRPCGKVLRMTVGGVNAPDVAWSSDLVTCRIPPQVKGGGAWPIVIYPVDGKPIHVGSLHIGASTSA